MPMATRSINLRVSVCYASVSQYQSYRTEPFTYSGKDVMARFFDHGFQEANVINDILSRNVPMEPLNASERQEFQLATIALVDENFRQQPTKREITTT